MAEVGEGQTEVEFHLVYQGKLPAAGQSNTRAREKQDMRRVFHKQLASLWTTHPFLIDFVKMDGWKPPTVRLRAAPNDRNTISRIAIFVAAFDSCH
jgi:hypothetical protein